MNKEVEEAKEILNSFEPDDLIECSIYLQALETVMNYIEKLEEVRKWYFENTVNKICTPEMLNKILKDDYIPKQKIHATIEELNKSYNEAPEEAQVDFYEIHENVIKILEDLLKGEF